MNRSFILFTLKVMDKNCLLHFINNGIEKGSKKLKHRRDYGYNAGLEVHKAECLLCHEVNHPLVPIV